MWGEDGGGGGVAGKAAVPDGGVGGGGRCGCFSISSAICLASATKYTINSLPRVRRNALGKKLFAVTENAE